MGGHGTVGYGGDDLPQSLGADIAYGVDTGNAGGGGFAGHDIAAFIQVQKTLHQLRGRGSADAHEKTLAGNFRYLAGEKIFDLYAGELAFPLRAIPGSASSIRSARWT